MDWPLHLPSSETIYTKVKGDLVNLGLDTGEYPAIVPLNAFVHAFLAYPQVRRFRVSWSTEVLMGGTSVTVLYDRRRHSVIVYSSYSDGDNGGLTSVGEDFLFTHVREEDFGKIATAHNGDISDRNWFDDLPKFGCRKWRLNSQ